MSDNAVSAQVSPRRWRRPPSPRRRKYATFRASQMLDENVAVDLPSKGGVVRTMVELEAEAERQSLIYAKRARFYSSLYYLFGLPAAILAAIAGATVLASTTGRLAAGIIALTSSALSTAVVFLDSGEQRDRATKTRSYWDDLYNDIHMVASGIRCKRDGRGSGFMVILGDGTDIFGAVVVPGGGCFAWLELAGRVEEGAAQVLEVAEPVAGHGQAAPAAGGTVQDGPDQGEAGGLAG